MCTVVINPNNNRLAQIQESTLEGFNLFESNKKLIVGSFPYEEIPIIKCIDNYWIISLGSDIPSSALVTTGGVDEIRGKLKNPSTLNGTFFHIVVSDSEAVLVSDRFGSVTVFYGISADRELILSSGYQSLLRLLGSENIGELKEDVIYEFLYMRRLFGEKTYHTKVSRIPSASVVNFSFNSTRIARRFYWSALPPQLTSFSQAVELLADGIRNSIEMYMSNDSKSYGLMLSGGLDSRGLLSIGGSRYSSYTTARTRNSEVRIAAELAHMFESNHKYLQRSEKYFPLIFDKAVTCSNAMTVFYESQFIGYIDQLSEEVDVIHTGIGMDIFFCGHYMAKYHPVVFGKPCLHFKSRSLNEGEEELDFINNITYRLKTSNLSDVVENTSRTTEMRMSLMNSIKEKMTSGRSLQLSGHSLWEYMHLTDLGRHYSMLMANSLTSKLEVHFPALENNLYDLAFMLSPELKVNWSVYLGALKKNSSKAMKVRSSNTNLPACYGLFQQSQLNIVRGLGRKIVPHLITGMPNYWERSWPLVFEDLNNEYMRSKIDAMLDSGRINDISFLNPDKLRRIYAQHKANEHDHGVLLGLLLTVEYGLLQYL